MMGDIMTQATVHQPDDKGFKSLLEGRKAFHELLRHFIPDVWTRYVEEDQLVRVDKSFISLDYIGSEADIVYRCKILGKEVYFYVLLELQSSVDFQMPWRLLQYMMEVWRSVMKDVPAGEMRLKNFRLPPIIPVVLYNGKGEWTAERKFMAYQTETGLFDKGLVDFEYYLVDITRMHEEDLMGLEGLLPIAINLEHVKDVEMLMHVLHRNMKAIQALNDAETAQLSNYIVKILKTFISPEEVRRVERVLVQNKEARSMISNLGIVLKKEYEEKFLKGLEEGRNKGLEEGLEEGRAEGLEEGRAEGRNKGLEEGRTEGMSEVIHRMHANGFTLDQIAAATGFSVAEVENLMALGLPFS
jgi:predicted transposase/invertase (TIGR01784 family)